MGKKITADEIRRQPEYQFITSGLSVPAGIILRSRTTTSAQETSKHRRLVDEKVDSHSSSDNDSKMFFISNTRLGRGIVELRKQAKPIWTLDDVQRHAELIASNELTTLCRKESQAHPTKEAEALGCSDNLNCSNSFTLEDGKVKTKELRFSKRCIDQPRQASKEGIVKEHSGVESEQIFQANNQALFSKFSDSSDVKKDAGSSINRDFETSEYRLHQQQSKTLQFQSDGMGDETHDGKAITHSFLKQILQDNSLSPYENDHKLDNDSLGMRIKQLEPDSLSIKTRPINSTSANQKSDSSSKRHIKSALKRTVSAPRRRKNGDPYCVSYEQQLGKENLNIVANHPKCDCRNVNEISTHHKLERSRSQYDSRLEKSSTYLHARSRTFTQASQYMTENKRGLTKLNVHYSQTNTAHNDRIIFMDLLKTAHVRNGIIGDNVYTMERRLYSRRRDPARSTTFYDRHESSMTKPKSAPPKISCSTKKTARTVADRKRERKERIAKKNEEIERGYTPTAWSLTPVDSGDIDHMLDTCRYLRVDVRKQPNLFGPTEANICLKSSNMEDVP